MSQVGSQVNAFEKDTSQDETHRRANQLALPASRLGQERFCWIAPSEIRNENQILEEILLSVGVENSCARASRLLADFHSISAVIKGTRVRLCESVGRETSERISSSRELMKERLFETRPRPLLGGSNSVADYFSSDPLFLKQERKYVLYADKSLRLIRVVNLAYDKNYLTEMDLIYILGEGLALNASAFILVDNYSSENRKLAPKDWQIARLLKDSGESLDMHLLDHIIFSGNKVSSFTGFVERSTGA